MTLISKERERMQNPTDLISLSQIDLYFEPDKNRSVKTNVRLKEKRKLESRDNTKNDTVLLNVIFPLIS